MKNLRFKTKLFLLIGVSLAGLLVFGALTYTTLNKVKVGGPIYNQVQDLLQLQSDILPPVLEISPARLIIYRMLDEKDPQRLQDEIAEFHDFVRTHDETQEKWTR
jgi:hypothetical protein